MGYVPETTVYLRAINLVANENYNADKQWFSNDSEMRQYLAGQRAAYADDNNNVISGEDGANLGMWYHMTLTTSANTPKWPVELTGCDLPSLTDDEQDQLNDLAEQDQWDDFEAMRGNRGYREMTDEAIRDQMAKEARDYISDVEDMGQGWDASAEYMAEEYPDTGLTDADKRYLDDMLEVEKVEHARFLADAGGHSNLGDGMSDWGKALNREVLEDAEPLDDYDESLTEDERMAQAGMSDEDIAGVHFIEKLNTQLDEARTCIGELLGMLDEAIGVEMHWYGWTPSWYVEAAAISCGIELEPTSDMCSRCGSCVCMGDCYDTGGKDPVDAGDFGAGTRDSVTVKLADTKLGQLAADWRFAEMGKAKAADDYRGVMTTPAGLRLEAKAAFMAGLTSDLDEAKKRLDDLPF